jgi:dihydrofolate reductase
VSRRTTASYTAAALSRSASSLLPAIGCGMIAKLIVYGGSSFVSSLIKEKLIDEFHFFINPIAIGSGASAFEHLDNWQHLKLRNCITCKSGLVLLHYDRI